jgi:CRP/FNR family transcriptional regulator, cyclic AMP receptor protein
MGMRQAARDVLGRHFLLKHLAADDLDRLAELARARSYAADQTIFLKGDPGTSLMAVQSGRVRICSQAADGREIVLNVMVPGDIFGEIALLDGGPRTAAAYADQPTTLIVINRSDFFAYLNRTPSASARLIEILCHRLRWVSEQFEDLNFCDLRSRLAKRLLHLADTGGHAGHASGPPTVRITQHMLAGMMGNTRQAVNRVLRTLEADGLIQRRRGAIVLLDRERLAETAASDA